jgi:hypothetical protein
MSLVGVTQTGDRLASLEALRDLLAVQIEQCDTFRDLAALTLRLTDVLEQIDTMPAHREASAADEIADRRNARRRARSTNQTRTQKRSS